MHKKLNLPDYKKDKKITESALLRRRFPNLYTKPVFPLFFPYILIKLISLGKYLEISSFKIQNNNYIRIKLMLLDIFSC